MSRRSGRRAFAWWLALMAVVLVLGAAEAIVSHGLVLAVLLVLLPAGGYLLGRRHGGRRIRHLDQRPARERAGDELARLRAAVADLEDAAGRPLAVITASYRRIQRHYGGGRS